MISIALRVWSSLYYSKSMWLFFFTYYYPLVYKLKFFFHYFSKTVYFCAYCQLVCLLSVLIVWGFFYSSLFYGLNLSLLVVLSMYWQNLHVIPKTIFNYVLWLYSDHSQYWNQLYFFQMWLNILWINALQLSIRTEQ